jgi:hypothetical protein
MNQTPVTITYSLEEVLKQIDRKLDRVQTDVTDISIRLAKVEIKLDAAID